MKFNIKLFIFVLIFLAIALPSIKSSVGLISIILLPLSLSFFLFQSINKLIFAYLVTLPIVGYGFFLGPITISLSEIIIISILFQILAKPIRIEWPKKLYFIIPFILTLIINTSLNFNLIKLNEVFKLLMLFLGFFLVAALWNRNFSENYFFKSFRYICYPVLFLFLFELFQFKFYGENLFRVNSINSIVYYLAFSIFFYIFSQSKTKKIFFIPSIAFISTLGILSYVSESRTGLIYSLFLCLYFILVYMSQRLYLIQLRFFLIPLGILFVGGIGWFLVINNSFNKIGSDESRIDVLYYYLSIFTENKLLGLGWGGWSNALDFFGDDNMKVKIVSEDLYEKSLSPHNTLLRVLVDLGIPGLFTFCISQYVLFKKASNILGLEAILFMVLMTLSTYFLADISSSPLLWFLLLIVYLNPKYATKSI